MAYYNATHLQKPITKFSDFYPDAIAKAMDLGNLYPDASIYAQQDGFRIGSQMPTGSPVPCIPQDRDLSTSGGFYSMVGPNGIFANGYNDTVYDYSNGNTVYRTEGADNSFLNGLLKSSDYQRGYSDIGGLINFYDRGNASMSGDGFSSSIGHNNEGNYATSPLGIIGSFLNSGYSNQFNNGMHSSSDYLNRGEFSNLPGMQTSNFFNSGNNLLEANGLVSSNSYQNSGNSTLSNLLSMFGLI